MQLTRTLTQSNFAVKGECVMLMDEKLLLHVSTNLLSNVSSIHPKEARWFDLILQAGKQYSDPRQAADSFFRPSSTI